HDALHGRGRVLRPDLDHGVGSDRGDGRTVRAQAAGRRRVDRRAVRSSRAADLGVFEGRVVNALWGLLRKETYHILRDRRTLAVLIFLPIAQVVLFGFSIRTDVRDVRLAIVDPSPDAATLAIRDRFHASG